MSILDYFKSVSSLSADEVRAFLKEKSPGEYNLLDVRQTKEYRREHIPGAKLIPLNELQERMEELDSRRPTIVYCGIGGRSRAAASLLEESGFRTVFNMKGGIKAWNGLIAEGPPETGMAYFGKLDDPGEALSLAWSLEEGTRRFYEASAERADKPEARRIYEELMKVEAGHQRAIVKLYREINGEPVDSAMEMLGKYLSAGETDQLMEGQMRLQEVLKWAEGRPLRDVLEYSIALEARLFDLYFRLKDRFKQGSLREVFSALEAEEKTHLDRFAALLEQNI